MSEAVTADTVRLLIPEMILVLTATGIYLGGWLSDQRGPWRLAALVGLALASYSLAVQHAVLGELFRGQSGLLLVDAFGHAMRWGILIVGGTLVLLARQTGDVRRTTAELAMLVMVLVGLMLVATAGDLVLLVLGFGLISVPTWVALDLSRRDREGEEATAKSLVLELVASVLLLYGLSFLYGMTGTTQLVVMRTRLAELAALDAGLVTLLPVGLVFVMAGLGFKLAAAPFHAHLPDVLQAAPASHSGRLAVTGKIAGVIGLVRLVVMVMPEGTSFAWQVLLALAAVTMTLGSWLALWQQNLRRLLTYASMVHAGFLLLGLGVTLIRPNETLWHDEGLTAVLFYLFTYSLAMVGVFAALAYLAESERELDGVDQLAGIGKTHPAIALALAICLLSLLSLPPLAGFWGKLTLLFSLTNVFFAGDTMMMSWAFALAAISVLSLLVLAAGYLRIIGVIYLRQPVKVPRAEGGWGPRLAALLAAAIIVALGLAPSSALQPAQQASQAVRLVAESVPGADVQPSNSLAH